MIHAVRKCGKKLARFLLLDYIMLPYKNLAIYCNDIQGSQRIPCQIAKIGLPKLNLVILFCYTKFKISFFN